VVQTFLTDSPSFKSALRRICWWRRSSRDTEKKLMIQRVINDCSWPPVGESTIAAAHRVDDSEEPLSSLPQTALSSDVSLYSRWQWQHSNPPPCSIKGCCHLANLAVWFWSNLSFFVYLFSRNVTKLQKLVKRHYIVTIKTVKRRLKLQSWPKTICHRLLLSVIGNICYYITR